MSHRSHTFGSANDKVSVDNKVSSVHLQAQKDLSDGTLQWVCDFSDIGVSSIYTQNFIKCGVEIEVGFASLSGY